MKRILMTMLATLLLLTLAAPVCAYHLTHTYVRLGATAGEALAVGDIVAIKGADGKAYKADANDTDLRPAVGIVGQAAASGAKAEIVVVGRATGWTSLTPGALVYLSETAGAATQVAPTWNQPLGFAISDTEYFFTFGNYVDTSAITAMGTLSQPLVYEGTTADEFETTLTVVDPTADRTATLPNASGTVLLSTAAQTAAGSISGVANGFEFEGATADAFETTVSVVDPTADRTVTFPNASGTVDLAGAATHDYAGAAVDWSLTAAEAQASYVSVSNANGAINAILPAAVAGKIRAVYNNSGQVLTLKVTGQAGETLATGKLGIYTDDGTDVVEIYEQP